MAQPVSRFGPAVRRQKGLGSIPLRVSFLFRKDVACGHCVMTLSLTINDIKMALIAAHLNAGVMLVVAM